MHTTTGKLSDEISTSSFWIEENHLSDFPNLTDGKVILGDFFFFKLTFKNFIYFWLRWVFVAAHGLSLVVVSGATLYCGARASHCSGFSCCRAWALGAWASAVVARGLSSCGSWALERRLSSCGAWA